jgi:cytochrome c-type biogenesis protein CcmH
MLLFFLHLALAGAELAPENSDLGFGEAPLLEAPSGQEAAARTDRLAKKLRCPVCQGLSVADSRSDAAVAMKQSIQKLVEKGYSEDQVVDYFIERYGEWVLLKPKYEHWFVWVAPILLAVSGLGFVLVKTAVRGKSSERASEKSEDRERVKSSEADSGAQEREPSLATVPSEEVAALKSYREQILAELDD